jgi:hypothetical protein
MRKRIDLPEIPAEERTPRVKALLGIIEQLAEQVQQLEHSSQLKKSIDLSNTSTCTVSLMMS